MKIQDIFTKFVLIGALAILALGLWKPQQPTTVQAADDNACNSSRSVQVSGAAVINVTPDRVLLQLGVQSNGATPDATQNMNSQEIKRVINAVRALGVEAKDIATDYYIVYPVYSNYESLVINGYRIDNTVSVTLRDVTLVDDTILAALKAGANEIQDVQFYTSELRKYRDQARALAVKAAGEKAQALADAAGVQTGCVLTISENSWAQYYGSWRGGREATLWAQNVIQNSNSGMGESSQLDDSPLSLGQIAVRAEVTASYSLR
jgi:uncharacterized protein YggE